MLTYRKTVRVKFKQLYIFVNVERIAHSRHNNPDEILVKIRVKIVGIKIVFKFA